METQRRTAHVAATSRAVAILQQYKKKVSDILGMVQSKPDAGTIEVAVQQMMNIPPSAHQIAWTITLSVVAQSSNEAHKRVLEENKRLKRPPNKIATFESVRHDEVGTPIATIVCQDGIMEVPVSIDVASDKLVRGQHVALAQNGSAVIGVRSATPPNPTCEFECLQEDGLIVARTSGDRPIVLEPGGKLIEKKALEVLRAGDVIEYDPQLRCVTKLKCRSVRAKEFVGESAENITKADTGGLEEVWKQIEQHLLGPLKRPELYERYGIETPRGVLFYGAPGCGKTITIKAVSRQILDLLGLDVNAPIIFRVSGASLLRPYVGEGQALLRSIARAAEEAAKEYGYGIVLLDDFEYSALHRGTGDRSSPAYSTLTASLLSMMDGLGKRNNRVTWIASSNRVDLLDSALLRPGRFSLQIEIPRPGFNACKEIFCVHLANAPIAKGFTKEAIAETGAQYIFSAEEENSLLKIEYADSETQEIFPYDIINGAIIAEAVRGAKLMAATSDDVEERSEASGIRPDELCTCLKQQLCTAVAAITATNAHHHYLNLPPDRRIVAVNHVYELQDSQDEVFVA